jgi:hypothetical protein
MEHFFKLTIEIMIEPFANRYSFGFQKGKCAHMMVDEIVAILDTKTERMCKVCDNKREQDLDVILRAFKSP